MCINIISTAPWSPWQTRGNSPFTNEESQPPRLQCVEEVVRLSKLEQRTCLPRASRIGGTVRSGWSHDCSDTSTARYIIYNIEEMGPLKSAHHPAKTDPAERALALSLPPPAPPRKKHPQPTQNAFPLRLPHHQCAAPGADSLSSPHLRMNCADLAEDSCPGRISDHVLTPSRTRISSPLPITREQRP
jgi:hypothetical protein